MIYKFEKKYLIFFITLIMSELATINFDIYKPSFNEDTDEYYDKCPYIRYERNCIRYECRCKAGVSFGNATQFKQHIKSKTHKDFIINYSKYYKEVDEAQDIIKELKVDNELLKRKTDKLTMTNRKCVKKIKDLEENNKNISKLLEEKDKKNKELEEIIDDLDNYEDCLDCDDL